jgi:hypothetical protein
VSQGCGFQRPAIESYNHQTVEFKKGERIPPKFVLLLPTASLSRKAEPTRTSPLRELRWKWLQS